MSDEIMITLPDLKIQDSHVQKHYTQWNREGLCLKADHRDTSEIIKAKLLILKQYLKMAHQEQKQLSDQLNAFYEANKNIVVKRALDRLITARTFPSCCQIELENGKKRINQIIADIEAIKTTKYLGED